MAQFAAACASSWYDAPCDDAVLPRKSKAWYTSAQGERLLVDVVNVHYDDDPPYYTISIEGAERSTVRKRLQAATDDEVADDAAQKAAAALAAKRAAMTTEEALLEAIAMLGGPAEEENASESVRNSCNSKPRPGSASKRATPSAARKPKPAAASNPWRDEKAAEEAGRCNTCKGKKKSIYRSCMECKRTISFVGGSEEQCVTCSQCCRECEICEMTLCPPCKRDVHTSCRKCGVRCKRHDFDKGPARPKEVCCSCEV